MRVHVVFNKLQVNVSSLWISSCVYIHEKLFKLNSLKISSFKDVEHTDIITPYGSFPVMLADRNIGLMWYLNMLQGTKMQGVHGSTESTNITGTAICPVVTWDSKITTLVSICGGISTFTSRYMKERGIYERFYNVIEIEWTRVFGNGPFPGSDISFDVLRPPLPIPQNMINFTQCARTPSKYV